MAILLKIVSVRVTSIQIMQIRVQNMGKRVWKSRYDGDVSVCNGWILCGGYIYPSTPSPLAREPSERAYTSTIHFPRQNHLLMC